MKKSRQIIFIIVSFIIGFLNVAIWDLNQFISFLISMTMIFPLGFLFSYFDSKEKGEI